MTSNRDRQQRAQARARLEREMAERASAAHRRRRRRTVLAAGLGTLVVLAGVTWIAVANAGDGGGTPEAAPTSSAAPQTCQWKPLIDPSASPAPSPAPSLPAEIKDVGTPPASGEPRSGTQLMTVETSAGTIKIQMDNAKAPCTSASFAFLAGKKFFDGSKCHRMTTSGIYVLQCGDPSSSGKGGPAYQFAEENLPADRRPTYPEGVVAMANAGAGTNGSQFFIVYKDTPDLPANYTIFGKVTEGLDVVKKVAEAGVNAADPQSPGDGAPKTEVLVKSLTVSASS